MMGGHTLYCDHAVFALVANNEVYPKADVVNQPIFVAQPGVMHYQAPPRAGQAQAAFAKIVA